jgi:hypothetical protein
MLKMMRMNNPKMVMEPIHPGHLIGKLFDVDKKRNNIFIEFRKMFIGGLSWQTTPGRFHFLFKEYVYFH